MGISFSQISQGLRYSQILAKAAFLQTWDKAASRRYLLTSLGSIPGLSAKLAQFLAMRLGEDTSTDPLVLEPMPLELVKARIEEESPRLHEEILELYPALQVASLGQVHRARLRSGEELALKIQFPHLKEAMEENLSIFRGLSRMGPPKKFQFEMDTLIDYFQESLLKELDYTHEARLQEEARRSLPMGWPIVIARPFPEYSSSRLLAQSWEASSNLSEIKSLWPHEARQQCAQNIMAYFLDALFRIGLLHTDPHPGNIGFRQAKGLQAGYGYELVLYDCGSMMRIPVAHRAILWQSILAYQNQRESVPFDTLVALGFEEQKLLSSAARLPAIFAKLWEPFCFPGAYDFSQWGLQETFEGILGEDRWWFRSAGPAWFLMLMRSAQGLLHAIQELDVKVPVRTIFEDLSLSFAEVPVPQRLREMSPQLIASTKVLAQYLCVRVCDGKGEELVNLEMPARCMDELEEIMPLETLNRMQELGIDLGILKRKVQRSAYVPQEIFEAQTQDRHYRVWLR